MSFRQIAQRCCTAWHRLQAEYMYFRAVFQVSRWDDLRLGFRKKRLESRDCKSEYESLFYFRLLLEPVAEAETHVD